MEVVVQMAAMAIPNKVDDLKSRFRSMAEDLRDADGFVRAEILMNHNTLQTQLLYRFDDLDPAMEFVKEGILQRIMQDLEGVLMPAGNLVLSVVEDVVEK